MQVYIVIKVKVNHLFQSKCDIRLGDTEINVQHGHWTIYFDLGIINHSLYSIIIISTA